MPRWRRNHWGMADLTEAIQNAATSPSEVQNGDQRVKARAVSELIDADKHLAAQSAAANPSALFRRIVPPGAR